MTGVDKETGHRELRSDPAMYDTVSVLDRDKDSINRVRQDTTRMCRVLKVLYEYVSECDGDFGDDRSILPLGRVKSAHFMELLTRLNLGYDV
ncbi:putative ubiquitin carboxyl-terminal hydrolase FAF-X [Portunus trituberculatus]|uniref:Putative ubiquitin carboxyl-terminal hydrolase FAF-X n=1 Tax=Portunus trituberculatus TaxID=210409 RepID=A0A5B7G1L6_PORTR|nr:putative ubiquitin carboxyl-terminal hydrolase FAF-X [Portunus trituberculatus]